MKTNSYKLYLLVFIFFSSIGLSQTIQIEYLIVAGVCSQIKMNFFAQNLREVSANLVKNFDTVFF